MKKRAKKEISMIFFQKSLVLDLVNIYIIQQLKVILLKIQKKKELF